MESKDISSDKIATADVIEAAGTVIQDALDVSINPALKEESPGETTKEKEKDNDNTSNVIKECFVTTASNDVKPKQEDTLDAVDVTMKLDDTQSPEEAKVETGNNKPDIQNIEVEKETKDETNIPHHDVKSPNNPQPQAKVLPTEVTVSKANVIVNNPDSVKRQHRKKRIARESTKLSDHVKSVEALRKSEEDSSSEENTSNSDGYIGHIAEENFDNDGESKQDFSVLERKVTTNVSCSHPKLKSANSTPDRVSNTSTDKREICIHVPIQNGDFEINVKCTAIKKRADNKSNGSIQHVFTLENNEMLADSEQNETHTDLKHKRLTKELMVNVVYDKENEKSRKSSKRLTSSSEVRSETDKTIDDGRIDYVYIEKMLKDLDEPQRKKFIADFVTWYMKPFYDNSSQFGTMSHNLLKIREENPEVDIIKLIQDPTSPDADPVLCGLVRKRSMKKETDQSSLTPLVDNKGLTAVADDKGPAWVVGNKEAVANTSGMKVDNKYPNQAIDKKCLDKQDANKEVLTNTSVMKVDNNFTNQSIDKKHLDRLDDNKVMISTESNKAIGNIGSMSNTKSKGKAKRSERRQTESSELTKEHKIAHDEYMYQAKVKEMNALYERERERIKLKQERRKNRTKKRNSDEDESVKNQKTGGIKSFFRKFICICKPKDVTYDM